MEEKASQVRKQLNIQEKLLQELTDTIKTLEDQLTYVPREPSPNKNAKTELKESEVLVPPANKLAIQNDRIAGSIAWIRNTRKHLEV